MSLEIIVLAAGRGTRMRSAKPKVLHALAGEPLLAHVLSTARELQPARLHVVVGHGAEQVREVLPDDDIHWVQQSDQLGTGHAVLQALPAIADDSDVLVLYGDVPLLSSDTLRALVAGGPALLTAEMAQPAGYGRILRDAAGHLLAVVEHRDATGIQRAISEVNTGVLAMSAADLKKFLPEVGNANSQGEYYLPDVLPLALASGRHIGSVSASSELDVLGVNDRGQLAVVERELQRRRARELMLAGVALADPARIDVRGRLDCGNDVFIDVNTVFEGSVTIGEAASIGPNCVLRDCEIGAHSTVHAMSHLEMAHVGQRCSVGPFARLRPGTCLADDARIGNFVETKKARIGAGSKVNHLSYIGDSTLGDGVNIGAGTITCNYDGVQKHETRIGDGVFVGSNATLVAPLDIANDGFVAAGSTVTRNIATSELAVGRGRQRNISGWRRPGVSTPGASQPGAPQPGTPRPGAPRPGTPTNDKAEN
ncbi:MAG: bifunctional UDP-N-acetylglucosamine diphosphorylase/glucosamine-1-phosphate N-acetyltransferase GlmU [Chromatocurvus sp.]